MSGQKIPIENIYYLFSYAWNRFEEARSIPIGGSPSPDLPNLLAKVLLTGTRSLLRRGLDRGYQAHEEEIATVRGHIELGPSLRLRARNARRLNCTFDELSHDLLHNRILKASLKRLARAPSIDRELKSELVTLARRMGDVGDMRLERSAFARVQLHRNNAYYDFLIKVAELAFDSLLPDPRGDGFVFQDVLRDEQKMARVFEDFVRNFYRAEQQKYAVEPLTIQWDAVRLNEGTGIRLPQMRVDVFLRSKDRQIIIDTKYYANALQSYYGAESYHSGNLYQLFSYLKNAAAQHPELKFANGMLLYPVVDSQFYDKFSIGGHDVSLATVRLDAAWPEIEASLLGLIV